MGSAMSMHHRLSLLISAASIFGALASILAILPLSIPYPPITYLKFDLAEIPVMIALLCFGPISGMGSALIYWGILLWRGEFSPIGPSMKFLAVFSMLMGLWIGAKIFRGSRLTLCLSFILGVFLRILSMSAMNYLIAYLLFPGFMESAARNISLVLGINVSGELSCLIVVLIFTAIFNLIHSILSIVPSVVIVKYISSKKLTPYLKRTWYRRVFEEG